MVEAFCWWKLTASSKLIFLYFPDGSNIITTREGGGVMLVIPKSPNPRIGTDLNHMNQEIFESACVEYSLTGNTSRNKQSVNVSCNPEKPLAKFFLEDLSTSIDFAKIENKPITLMGHYNLNYRNEKERQFLETVAITYGLRFLNTEFSARVQCKSMTLIDYNITVLPQTEKFQAFFSDALLRTLHGKQIGHSATSLIATITIQHCSKYMIKKVFDITNYIVQMFQQMINNSCWGDFYKQDCAKGMFTIFSKIIERALKCTHPW